MRHYNIDVRDWFTGVMDSRRLLTLVEGLPEDSMFHKWAVRGGDWTEEQYMTARTINEIALSRADGKGYMPDLLKSPMQAAAEEFEIDYRRQRHRDNLKQLKGDTDDGDHR